MTRYAGSEYVVSDPGRGLAKVATIDARGAMAEALRVYLRAAVFSRYGGDAGPLEFQLEAVSAAWPEPNTELRYPTAVVLDGAEGAVNVAHALTTTCLEETWDVFGHRTVLWKTGEASGVFQIDFWANDEPTRAAIAARLPQLFAPGEDGARVILKGDCRYYDRPVRAAYISARRVDMEGAVYVRERRLTAQVRLDIDEVHLRCAVVLQPSVVQEVDVAGATGQTCE